MTIPGATRVPFVAIDRYGVLAGNEAGLVEGVGGRFVVLDNPEMVSAAEAEWLEEEEIIGGTGSYLPIPRSQTPRGSPLWGSGWAAFAARASMPPKAVQPLADRI